MLFLQRLWEVVQQRAAGLAAGTSCTRTCHSRRACCATC
jgi:hypothetical protein